MGALTVAGFFTEMALGSSVTVRCLNPVSRWHALNTRVRLDGGWQNGQGFLPGTVFKLLHRQNQKFTCLSSSVVDGWFSEPSEKITIVNPLGQKLVGILHDTGSKEVVILCHGLNSSKDVGLIANLATGLAKTGLSVFRFDFAGNGESEGEFEFGNYAKESEDLHEVVLYWMRKGRVVKTIFGHSKGGSTVLVYASKFNEVHTIVNASGRLDLKQGLDRIVGADYLENAGPWELKEPGKNHTVLITKESLMERLELDLIKIAQSIPKEIRICTVHGSDDEVVSVDNAYMCDKVVANHTLRIIDGADHMYSKHAKELEDAVKVFILNDATNSSACK